MDGSRISISLSEGKWTRPIQILNTQIMCNNNLPLGVFTIRNIHTIVQYVSVMEKNLRQTTCSTLMLSMAKLVWETSVVKRMCVYVMDTGGYL